jgi:hypothetical protein
VVLSAVATLAIGIGTRTGRGDEPRGLGRLFRLGGSSSSTRGSVVPKSADSPAAVPPAVVAPSSFPGSTAATPTLTDTGGTQRIRPQPRVTRAVTDSDPLLTQVSLVRDSSGKRFGMFLQIYADGTVIDNDGVHRVGGDVLRPIVQAIQSGDLHRARPFCGGPSADFLEQVQLIVYERSLGRLRAMRLGYSGNPQGCDEAIQKLHKAVEALTARVSPAPTPPASPSLPADNSPPTPPADAPVIPLTPEI